MDKVFIKGLKINACHGVLEFEKSQPQPFVFDVEMYCDFYSAAVGDSLSGTINYAEACEVIRRAATENVCNLLETLAYNCAFALISAFPQIEKIRVAVNKPQAPVAAEFTTVGAEICLQRRIAYLSLGSSLGDKKAYLDGALKMLSAVRGIEISKVSDYISTEPYGGAAKNDFLNCAAEIYCYLSPRDLLAEIHKIENFFGRERTVRWGDRTLDIDIILFGEEKICQPDLIIPHPEYLKREFVLKPLKQIAPHLFVNN